MKVVIINGSGGVGKDTFVSLCQSLYPKGTICNTSSIEPVKEFAKLIGWDGGKTEKDRKFLSDLKVALTEWRDIPLSFILREVRNHALRNAMLPNMSKVLFIHIREPQEIAKAVNLIPHPVTTLLIRSNRVPHITSNMADAGVEDYPYSYILDNDGDLADLKLSAQSFLEEVLQHAVSKKL